MGDQDEYLRLRLIIDGELSEEEFANIWAPLFVFNEIRDRHRRLSMEALHAGHVVELVVLNGDGSPCADRPIVTLRPSDLVWLEPFA